jgi:SET domain-containing protein
LFFFSAVVMYAGRGVFATESIARGQFVVQYAGELITAREGNKREKQSESSYRFFFQHKERKMW